MPPILRTGNSSGGRVGKPVSVVKAKPHGTAKGPGSCCK